MITMLARVFLKPEGKSEAQLRKGYGVLCGAVGVGLNLLLFLGKLLAGLASGSIAVVADAVNNLSDAGSSVVTLLGFHLAEQKPDHEHPFGHGRAEYLSGLVVSLLILLMGFELAQSSVGKILHPLPAEGERFYLCREGACAPPVGSREELERLFRETREPVLQ